MTFNEVRTGTKPLLDAVNEFNKSSSQLSEQMVKTTEDFKDTSTLLSIKMIKAIERFDKSSSNLANKMLWLTLVIAALTVLMIIIMVFD